MFRFFPLFLILLAACEGEDTRYLIDSVPATAAAPVRLAVATLEVRDVSLPAYAEESQFLIEAGNGALTTIDGAVWADEPVRAATILLADHIGRLGSASVAAEPWPLENPAQAAVHVRVADMVARSSGQFDLKGQFAISSYEQAVKERIESFEISVPLPDTSPASIAKAYGMAMRKLANDITKNLAR